MKTAGACFFFIGITYHGLIFDKKYCSIWKCIIDL